MTGIDKYWQKDGEAALWFRQGRFFKFQQHQIFYRTEGEGEPLLLLHGFPTSSLDWNKIWKPLSQKYKLVTLDYIGYGFSDKPSNYAYSIKNNADIVEKLLAHLNIDHYHLLAHDLGDSVAQELLAMEHDGQRKRIQSCCLLNGGLFPETHRPTKTQKLLLSPLGFIVSRMVTYKKFTSSFSVLFPQASTPSEAEMTVIYDLIVHNGGSKIMHKLIKYIRERQMNRERWVSALQNADCPLLLVNGISDPVSGLHMVKRYRELVPNSDVVEMEFCGHYPQLEYPEIVVQHYFEFRDK